MDTMRKENEKRYDIVCLGRATIDINPVHFTDSFAASEEFHKFVGGSAANTSVGLAKLGCKVGFFCAVSDDSLGDYVISYLADTGVDTSHIVRAGKGIMLGLAFTEVIDGKTNLMMYRDANTADLMLCADDIDEEVIAASRYLLVSGTALSASPSREAALKAVALANKHGVKVIFDIDYRAQVWKNMEEVSTYYTMAAKEAFMIQGSREEFDRLDHILAPGLTDGETAARWFGEKAEILIIKHGSEGSYVFTKNETWKVLPFRVKLLKATGGGDGYSSAFISGLLKGMPIEQCAERGTASASIAVSSDSCSAAMPTEEELNAFIDGRHAEGQEVVFRV